MSKLARIKEKLAALIAEEVTVKMGVVKTDKAVIEYDGDEDLKSGVNVFVTNDAGERVPAENGEYVTEDNKVITVVDGKVESIVDPVAEVDAAEDAPAENEEKPAEENMEVENPDGTEESTPDAVEELRKEVNELYKIVDSILEKIGETRREADERLTKIEKMSAAKPADVQFEEATVAPTFNSGDKKTDERLARIKQMGKNWRK